MVDAKYILLLGAGAASIYGVSYLLKIKRLSTELETSTKVAIHKISLSGIALRIDVTLKNPSGGTIKVKQPFVKLIYGDSTVASSELRNINITIPKFSEVNLELIMINIGFLNLASTVPALLKEYRDEGKLSFTVKTITTINDSIPYSKTDPVVLQLKSMA